MRRFKIGFTGLLLAVCIALTGCAAKGISAEEWILKQYDSTNIIEMYCEELDDIVAIYIAGGMTKEEYLSELTNLSNTFTQMESEREKEDIKVGSHTEDSKLGQQGYENLWIHLRSLTNSLIKDESLLEPRQLAYFYMAYQEAIEQDFEDYYTAYLSAGGEFEEDFQETEGAANGN